MNITCAPFRAFGSICGKTEEYLWLTADAKNSLLAESVEGRCGLLGS